MLPLPAARLPTLQRQAEAQGARPVAAAAHAPDTTSAAAAVVCAVLCAAIRQDRTHAAVTRSSSGPNFAAGWRQLDLRKLMSELPAAELALAGHAVALAAWHEVHPRCRPKPLVAHALCH